jgi:hypothetical protein
MGRYFAPAPLLAKPAKQAGRPYHGGSVLPDPARPPGPGFGGREHPFLSLQRSMGNRAVMGFIGPHAALQRKCAECARGEEEEERFSEIGMQPKLILRPRVDFFEREADRVAGAVLGMDSPPVCATPLGVAPALQRKCKECEEEEEEELQRKPANGAAGAPASDLPGLASQIQEARGLGQPLPPAMRDYFEPRFGQDFSRVRIHSSLRAANLAGRVRAQAFTVGQDIFFGLGFFRPDTFEGRKLIAHELTHTIQQRNGGLARATLQRKDDATITEAEVKKLLKEEEAQEAGEMSTEELAAISSGVDEGGPAKDAEVEAAAVQPEGPTEEIEIPEFDAGTGEACPSLLPEETLFEEETKEEAEDEGIFSTLLGFVTSGGVLGYAGSLARDLAGTAAKKGWDLLPESVKAAAINKAINVALAGVSSLPLEKAGLMAQWIQAGFTGFLERLKKVPDSEKIQIFEKAGSIVLGNNTAFTLGYLKGIVKGFFLDGLVGIIQMIIDLVCLPGKIIKFIDGVSAVLKGLPDEIQDTVDAIRDLSSGLAAAAKSAGGEFWKMLKDPARFQALVDTVADAGKNEAKKLGATIAEGILKFWKLPPSKLGDAVGRLAGLVIFEIALAAVTGGGGLAVTAAKGAARTAVKLMAQIGKRILFIMKKIGDLLGSVKNTLLAARKFLTGAFKSIADKVFQVIERVRDLFSSFFLRCRTGSTVCKVPKSKKKPPKRSPKCKGRFVPRLGGHTRHDTYCQRVTRRRQDFRIVLGPVLKCTFDAKVGRELIECKTGYGWLANPTVQKEKWFPWAVASLDKQRYRCLLTASRCGFVYKWYMENSGAASYLAARWKGVPPVLHKP